MPDPLLARQKFFQMLQEQSGKSKATRRGFHVLWEQPQRDKRRDARNFDDFLREKFPGDIFTPTAGLNEADQQYEFDVRMDYHWNNFDDTPIYLAIMEYVLTHFSTNYGIDIQVYHAP